MPIHDRLKIVRESLGMSQNTIAKAAGASLPAWQGYEAGKNIPGGKVLKGLASLGINVNWLLIGEGEVIIDKPWENTNVPGLGMRLKEIRGEHTKESFSETYNISIKQLEGWEGERLSPDINFLAKLSQDFDISPSWLLLGQLPKGAQAFIFKEGDIDVVTTIDVKTLKEILVIIKETALELIDEGLGDIESLVELDQNAELIAYMYEDSLEHELKNTPLRSKKMKVKRLIGIARELSGKK